jgi:hypothetical protein
MSIIVVRPGSKRTVIKTKPEWQLRGWFWGRRGLEGKYQTKFGSWWGFVDMREPSALRFFVYRFPIHALRRHPKNACISFKENNWAYIDMHRAINIDAGILEVEKILTEALELYRH